jgi:hypothetical protein
LDEVVLRALENDPARRYQKASEVKSRVETISSSPEQVSTPAAAAAPEECFFRWLGFPIVVERAGSRTVVRREALKAFAILFGLLTLLFGSISLIVGHSLFGWVGISGQASLQIRLLLAGGIVAVGAWRTLRAPPRELPKGPHGTVVLPAPSRWQAASLWLSSRRGAWFIGLSCLALIGLVASRTPEPTSFNSPSHQIAERDPATGALVANLPKGGAMELIALGHENAPANAWWAPDGTPMPDTILELEETGASSFPGKKSWNIVLRFRKLPAGVTQASAQLRPTPNSLSIGSRVLQDGKLLNDGTAIHAADFPDARALTLRQGFGIEEWRTISTHDRNGNSTVYPAVVESLKLQPRVHQISENKGEATLTLLMEKAAEDWMVRVIAVDTNGVEHVGSNGAGTPVQNTSILSYSFSKLPLTKVKDFRLQARPVYWVEFRNIALEPRDPKLLGKSKKTFRPTSFGDSKQIELTGVFDFDTGASLEYSAPEEKKKSNAQPEPDRLVVQGGSTNRVVSGDGATPLFYQWRSSPTNGSRQATPAVSQAWMLQHGFDIFAGLHQIGLAQMEVADLSPADWDNLAPHQLMDRINRNLYAPPLLPSTPGASLPLTHGFRTRQGATGILQILAFDSNKPSIRLRYKIIQRAHFE